MSISQIGDDMSYGALYEQLERQLDDFSMEQHDPADPDASWAKILSTSNLLTTQYISHCLLVHNINLAVKDKIVACLERAFMILPGNTEPHNRRIRDSIDDIEEIQSMLMDIDDELND